MKKIYLVLAILIGFQISVIGQSNPASLSLKRADLLAHAEAKDIIAKAFPDKDLNAFTIHSFNLVGNTTDINNGAITSKSFSETASCGSWTTKQIALMDEYAKSGSVFVIESITLITHGAPGTPYNPEDDKMYSLPNITVNIID